MKKNWLFLSCLLLLCVLIAGSVYVESTLSAISYDISAPGNYYLPKGTNVHFNGISCSNIYDYSSTPAMATMITDCGGASLTIPTMNDDYLLVVEDTGSTCSGMMVGSPSKIDAVCKIYPYNAGSVNISCNKNHLNAGDKASCTVKSVTSSDGIKALSFVVDSKDLVVKNFESNFFNIVDSGNFYTFVAKKDLRDRTEYLVAAFDIENVGASDGISNAITFNSISYTDNTTILDLGSASLEFKEDRVEVTPTTSTKKADSVKTTTKKIINPEETTVSTVITAGIDSESPKTDSEEGPKVESSTSVDPETGEVALSGSTAVVLTVFVATMSIASGIGIAIVFTKIK